MLEGVITSDLYTLKSKEIKLDIINKEIQIDSNKVDIERELAAFELTKQAFKAFNFNDISFSERLQTLTILLSIVS